VVGALRGRAASFKLPRHARLVDALPMTPSGKVRKVELRAKALEDLGDPHHG
jgi:fatty-acyl-CoA synthase